MPIHIEILGDASREANEAREWYAVRSLVTAKKFAEAVAQGLAALTAWPTSLPTQEYGAKRCLLRGFPYPIVF